MRIGFVVPGVFLGGGVYTVLQHADFLSGQGHDVHLVTTSQTDDIPRSWHPSLTTRTILTLDEAQRVSFDVIIASSWLTVGPAVEIRANRHVYFVQSVESRFYPPDHAELRSAAEATYALGLPVITIASWIKEHLEARYSSRVWLARNGIDKTVFHPQGTVAAPAVEGLRILVEGPLGVEFKNVPRAIRLARMARPAEVWLLTSSPVTKYPGVDRVFSQVAQAQTAEIYRSCDVLLKLSLVEGCPLPPLEMFACGGTALVYNLRAFDEYIRPDVNALVREVHDESGVVRSLRSLQNDPGRLAGLRSEAAATVDQWPDWAESSAHFTDCLRAIVDSPPSEVTGFQSRNPGRALPDMVHSAQRRRRGWNNLRSALPPIARRALYRVHVLWWGYVTSQKAPRDNYD